MELSEVDTGLNAFLAGRRGSGKVSIDFPKLLSRQLEGSREGHETTLENEVCCLTPVAVKVKALVTTDDFSRAFCLQMAFQ